MLIRFNVGNFLSFDEIQEFSMIAGKTRSKTRHIYSNDKIKLLKFAALFGANASGKSNLVEAIDFSRDLVIYGLPEGHTNKYHKGSNLGRDKKSYFEFEVKLDDKYYSYGYEICLNRSKIISEWMIELSSNGADKEIFSRDVETGEYSISKYFSHKQLINKLDIYSDDVKNDGTILFLRLMNQNKDNIYKEFEEACIFRNMYEWLKNGLNINYPDRPISNYSYFMTNERLDEINKVIEAFGMGITNFKIVDVSPETIARNLPKDLMQRIISDLEKKTREELCENEEDKVSNKIMIRGGRKEFVILEIAAEDEIIAKTIKFGHENNENLFDLSEESDGTVRILDLLEILLDRSCDKTYVIDEIDRCLHPQLTYKFVETFLELAENRNIQLVVTSHESRLLDFELLRRDEIWFVDKDKKGESNLYSLEEYNTRFDQKIDKAYLEGRYGGVPVFNTVFPIKGEC